ncbi:PREDICTED: uncharacterized protein LOC105559947 [Vollenhovia emeryi]|uniref:uncharacterized protein LOC105559947 n=1 Tax=Vollenhovia emeryi TaxID=411798 RepID=UPI0005F4927F|nr:PREDICTED: uncharacterized protein LOC105559947 [Vollenhovia emeryi]XP_011864009.1 PREDICTED: uncharacterized protein LOC105559947 [Vollenhovia emeryi]XP_011864010.1 PREDICTED: uncharacterized protein LOC105559947 [Vollenhovia emeryi]XP_011864011.1 PREDICTED: uncharacterized protein LOC105559947 [Vollenhovia emeryi]
MVIEEWMWKHYTKENSDTLKCNRCEEVFSNHDRLQILKYHLYDEHEITELDEHPRRYSIKENYKITCLTATCKHCMKRINLAMYGVHILIIHLKVIHPDKYNLKKGKRRSRLWDKYDERGNYATCKGCNRTITIKGKCPTTNLKQHLLHCRHFNNDKYQFKKIRRISRVWDEYDVTDKNATCKECKKIVNINVKHPTIKLGQHLFNCRNCKIDNPDKAKLETMPKISSVWDKYDVTDNNATCKACKTTITIYDRASTSDVTRHLLHCPRLKIKDSSKSKLERRISRVWEKYDVTDNNAICKGCKKTLKINGRYPTSCLRQHLIYCRAEQTTSRSLNDNPDFHGNGPQEESAVRTNTRKLFKRKKEETETSEESYSSSEFEKDRDEVSVKWKTEAKVYNLRKRRTYFVDEDTSSASSGDEDLNDTVQFQSEIQTSNETNLLEEIERKDFDFE